MWFSCWLYLCGLLKFKMKYWRKAMIDRVTSEHDDFMAIHPSTQPISWKWASMISTNVLNDEWFWWRADVVRIFHRTEWAWLLWRCLDTVMVCWKYNCPQGGVHDHRYRIYELLWFWRMPSLMMNGCNDMLMLCRSIIARIVYVCGVGA